MVKTLYQKYMVAARRMQCLVGGHDWTCAAREGIKPDPVKLKANPVGYFWEYAKMYCKRCGHVSTLR